jgi:two-component system NarL family sensor kinase
VTAPADRALAAYTAEASRTTSRLRFGLLAVVALLAVLDPTRVEGPAFWGVLAGYGVVALGWLVLVTRRPAGPRTGLVATAVDLVAISALALLAGGGGTLPSLAYVVVPVMAAFRYRPALSAGVGLLTVASFLLSAAIDRAPVAAAGLLAEGAVLALVAVATFLLSVVLARRADRIRGLLDDAAALTAQALDAEQLERRRLAEELHDHALQTLLVAGQELDELAADHPEVDLGPLDAAVRGTVRELRDVVGALHPYVLDEAGVAVALRRLAERLGGQAGLAVAVEVPDDLPAAPHDRLLYGVARELLTNVVKHAGADRVAVLLADDGPDRRLEVDDDGCGLDPAALGARLVQGHIGLASTRARVEGVGGTFWIGPPPPPAPPPPHAGSPRAGRATGSSLRDTTTRGTRIVVRVPRGGSAS